MSDAAFDLSSFPVRLDPGARVVRLEQFDGTPAWYERNAGGNSWAEGRLVTMHSFTEPWDAWEMHPLGEELVVCIAGSMLLHQEIDGVHHSVELTAGQAIVNPAGVWHTADTDGPCIGLFITAGEGTEHRGR